MEKNMQKGILMISMTLIFAIMLSGAVSAADGDVIYVATNGSDDNDGYTWATAKLSIKNGTGTVNSNGTVNIANGLYTGAGNTNILIDKNMTIQGQSKTGTIINGTDSARIFNITGGVNVTILNLTITNGRAPDGVFPDSFSGEDGGAIYNEGTLQIIDCILSNNRAGNGVSFIVGGPGGNGGAIYNSGTLQINNCTFSGNYAGNGGFGWFGGSGGSGGAIYNTGTLQISNCTFSDNNAGNGGSGMFGSGSGGSGGAIYNDGTLTVEKCNFTGNTASAYGGAIYNVGTLTVTNTNFNSNHAENNGGAIENFGTASITNCTFDSNTAAYGGAIHNWNGDLTITGSTFKYNGAVNYGGAIHSHHDSISENNLIIEGSTFKGNIANYGGAISNTRTPMTITGSTFINNSAISGNGAAIWNWMGSVTAHFNRFVDSTVNEIYDDSGSVDATLNWWGSNVGPSGKVSGNVNANPWLYMTIAANSTTIKNGETSLITVSFNNQYDGTTVTPLNPVTGHIPDGTPVTFNTDLGSIGCKTIEKQTMDGIATAILTADELAGIAHVNATTDNQTLFVNVTITPKSSLYLKVTPSKADPVTGDTVVYTLKVGNKGPDAAKDVVMTYVVPEGLEFAGAKVDVGEWKYDAATRTITWNISEVPVGDPYMWLSLSIAQAGQYLINPVLTTSTYDPTLNSDTQSITVNAAAQTNTTVNAASKTIPLQKTGLPLSVLVMAILAVFGGFVIPKRK